MPPPGPIADRVGSGSHAVDRVLAGRGGAVGDRERVGDRVPSRATRPPPARPHRARPRPPPPSSPPAPHPSSAPGPRSGPARPSDPGALERRQADARVAALAERVDVRRTGLESGRGDHERDQHYGSGEGGGPAPAHDQPRPARPRAARLVIVADVRPVEPVACLGEHDREQRQCDDHADEGISIPRSRSSAGTVVAARSSPAAQSPPCAAERDRATGGLHRADDRLVALVPWARSSRQRTTTSRE